MALYSAKALNSKLNGSYKSKAYKLEKNYTYTVWFPVDSIYARKMHYNIHDVKRFRDGRYKAIQCIKYDIESDTKTNGKKCPMCDYIKELWEKWRNTSDKNAQKEIVSEINKLESVEYYINAVIIGYIDDKKNKVDSNAEGIKYRCVPFRLTKTMFKSLLEVIEDTPIERVIWKVKMWGDKKIEYKFTEDLDSDLIDGLVDKKDKIISRPSDKGGLVDLEELFANKMDEDEYVSGFYGSDDSGDDDLMDDEDEEPKQHKKQSTQQHKKSIEIEEDEEEVSLDNIDLDDEPKQPTKHQPKKQVVEDDELDDFEVEQPKQLPKKQAKKQDIDDDEFNVDDDDVIPF